MASGSTRQTSAGRRDRDLHLPQLLVNFRLRSVSPRSAFEAHGINTAIGRRGRHQRWPRHAARNAHGIARHRVPEWGRHADRGTGSAWRPRAALKPRLRRVDRRAGARQGGRQDDRLAADQLSLLRAGNPLLDAVLQRAKTSGVRTVICDGEVIYRDGKFTKVDQDAALRLAPGPATGPERQRSGAPPTVEGAAAPRQGVLR